MSASLVGSEMCIRDSFAMRRCRKVVASKKAGCLTMSLALGDESLVARSLTRERAVCRVQHRRHRSKRPHRPKPSGGS
eukprot:8327916-Alexandrium_andersonii.AAC.1